MDNRADRTAPSSVSGLEISATHSELAALRPASSAELNAASSITTNRNTAQDGNRCAIVWTPIIDTSVPLGSVTPSAGFAARKPKTDNAIGTIPNRRDPNANAFTSSFFLTANARCQFDWSDIDPAISPIDVTIPNENATPASNRFLVPATPPRP